MKRHWAWPKDDPQQVTVPWSGPGSIVSGDRVKLNDAWPSVSDRGRAGIVKRVTFAEGIMFKIRLAGAAYDWLVRANQVDKIVNH